MSHLLRLLCHRYPSLLMDGRNISRCALDLHQTYRCYACEYLQRASIYKVSSIGHTYSTVSSIQLRDPPKQNKKWKRWKKKDKETTRETITKELVQVIDGRIVQLAADTRGTSQKCVDLSPLEQISQTFSHEENYTKISKNSRPIKLENTIAATDWNSNLLKFKEQMLNYVPKVSVDLVEEKHNITIDAGENTVEQVSILAKSERNTEDLRTTQSVSSDEVSKKKKFKQKEKKTRVKNKKHDTPQFDNIQGESMKNIKKAASNITKQVSLRKQSKKGKQAQTEPDDLLKYKIIDFNRDLKSYVDACAYSGMTQKAHNTVIYYCFGKKNNNLKPTDVEIFNLLMHSWARHTKNGLLKINSIFSIMKDLEVKPNLQSFAAYFEHVGRSGNIERSVIEDICQQMKTQDLNVCDILTQCKFTSNEKHYIEKGVAMVIPNQSVNYHTLENVEYIGPLVEHLNQKPLVENMIESNPHSSIISPKKLMEYANKQVEMERDQYVTVPSILNEETVESSIVEDYRNKIQLLKKTWRLALHKGFTTHLKMVNSNHRAIQDINWVPYLSVLTPHKYVDLMMQEVDLLTEMTSSYSPGLSWLYRRLGLKVLKEYYIENKVKKRHIHKVLDIYKKYVEVLMEPDAVFRSHREVWQTILQETNSPALDIFEKYWPPHIVKGVGKLLYSIIISEVKVDVNIFKKSEDNKLIPAFYTVVTDVVKRQHEINIHSIIVKLYKGAKIKELIFQTSDLPMIVPPIPWMSINYGGFLLDRLDITRLPYTAHHQRELLNDVSNQQLYPVLDSLNCLSSCAWVVNKHILDIAIGIFNNKGNAEISVPPPVSECPAPPDYLPDMDADERKNVFYQRLKLTKERSEMYSLWCNELYKLSIANMFRDKVFWLPHNMDFRGRVYPCPPHFNHLGGDLVRSILLFAKGKPLGPKGLDWLKIHLINLTGLKKRSSNEDRLEYANSIMGDVLDSADKPLEGRKWWQKSDEPWQTLSCCMEIAKATRSPDHTQHICHYPVHQDGSCNGLQHYAALGRDKTGAESVNLHPFDVPQDVYSDVAELVEKLRKKDVESGVEIAPILDGHVKRKVIKQTVMTTVYGVTHFGAVYQIMRQLKDISDFPQQKRMSAARYLTHKTFQSLEEMFTSTKEIQDWLTVVAHLISVIRDKPVEWVTPLGFPVVQPYHKKRSIMKSGLSQVSVNSVLEQPNSMKQKNAFPPNYIHSLDSTHMMLTALNCQRSGITFVSVHDCFWTHACDIGIMNKMCREQFVNLHKQPILDQLSKFLVDRFGYKDSEILQNEDNGTKVFLNSVLAKVPDRGEFNLENVLDSTYFFS